jgi:hypothetical protein
MLKRIGRSTVIAIAAALAIVGGLAFTGTHTPTASAQVYYTYPTTTYYSAYPYYYYSDSYYPYDSYSYSYYPYSYYYSNDYPYAYGLSNPYINPCAYWGYAC